MRTKIFLIAALAGILQACSGGDASTANSPGNNDDVLRSDRPGPMDGKTDVDFARKAAMGGMAEVELGRLAANKATDPKVKQFGEQMVTDHGKAGDELKGIARSKNIDLPTELDATHKSKKEQLDQRTGRDFDRAYVDAMVEDHKKDLELFRAEAANGSDPELKAFASRTAEVVQMHLHMIQEMQKEMK